MSLNRTLRSALALSVALSASVLGPRPLSAQAEAHVDSTPRREAGEPVPAHRGGHVDLLHGVPVPDPYRWMEDLDAPRTIGWVDAQDARARRFAAGFRGREELHDRIARLADVRRFLPPRRRGHQHFYVSFQSSGGPGTPGTRLLVRDEANGSHRVLLSGGDLPEGRTLTRMVPGPEGRYVAYAVAPVGSRWETVGVLEVATGRRLPDRLEGVNGGASTIVWAPDGQGFYYEVADLPPEGEERTARVRNERILFHRLGDAGGEDRLLHDPASPDIGLTTSVTGDGGYLVIVERDPSATGDRLLYADLATPEARVRPLVADDGARHRFVGSRGSRVWFRTDRGAPNGRIVTVDLDDASADAELAWSKVIPETDHAINTWLGARMVGRHLIVGYLVDARTEWRVHDLDGEALYTLELPRLGSIWSGFAPAPDPEASETFYSLSGLADPGSIYRLDLETGRSELFRRPDLGYDPAEFLTRQVFYESADGTRVPMYLVHGRDLAEDDPAPVVVYGYGFGGWSAAPWFQPHLAAWLRMGGVWALPNLRGGGEYGESWHRAGSGRNKQTAIDDYLAAAEWLVAEGITSPDLLVLNASSAGGAVGGAALVQRPELFGAAILDYPVLDMLRYDEFTGGRRWRGEFGTPEDPEDFEALLAYSPYHNVRVNRCHAATLVSPGELDEVTPPLHAYKFTASLQYAQSCDAPILLRLTRGAGHSSGATIADAVDTWTDQLSFLIRVLGEHGWEPRSAGRP